MLTKSAQKRRSTTHGTRKNSVFLKLSIVQPSESSSSSSNSMSDEEFTLLNLQPKREKPDFNTPINTNLKLIDFENFIDRASTPKKGSTQSFSQCLTKMQSDSQLPKIRHRNSELSSVGRRPS